MRKAMRVALFHDRARTTLRVEQTISMGPCCWAPLFPHMVLGARHISAATTDVVSDRGLHQHSGVTRQLGFF